LSESNGIIIPTKNVVLMGESAICDKYDTNIAQNTTKTEECDKISLDYNL